MYYFNFRLFTKKTIRKYTMLKLLLNRVYHVKAELLLEDIFSRSILEIKITKTAKHTTFKTDIVKVVLVFLFSNFFTNENSQRRKLRAG